GAAGGCGYGLAAGWGGQLLPGGAGPALVAGLPGAVDGAVLVISREGQYHANSEGGEGGGAGRAVAAAPTPAVPVAVEGWRPRGRPRPLRQSRSQWWPGESRSRRRPECGR